MGTLRRLGTQADSVLLREHLIGRSPLAALQLDGSYVSAQHATIRWAAGRWQLKDLGSRNGTIVDGVRLQPRQPLLLTLGARISFGRPEQTWEFTDDSPPRATLVPLDDEFASPLVMDGPLLPLPSAADPKATLLQTSAGTWQLELENETIQLVNQQEFEVFGRAFRFNCPDAGVETSTTDWPELPGAALSSMSLAFRVSTDEEHVEMRLARGEELIDLGSRGHNYLLLLLARQRLADEHAGLADGASGWVYQDDLAASLKTPPERLNIDIFRIRRQFSAAGVPNAVGIIERRPRTKQLRIGIGNLSIQNI